MEVRDSNNLNEIALYGVNNSEREFPCNCSSNIFGQLCMKIWETSDKRNCGVERMGEPFAQTLFLNLVPFDRIFELGRPSPPRQE